MIEPNRWFAKLRCALVAVTVAGTIPSQAASVHAERPIPAAPAVFPFGVAWYPEWYGEVEWSKDLDRMQQAHVSFVRIAEFAWARMEPSEGHYDFAWLDRAIEAADRHGIKVLIGTPTAAPPAWLTTKYPDVLAIDAEGHPVEHGWRRHFSVASPRYRREAARIAGELARRYGHNPAVIGFQIDNEYGRETFDPAMLGLFQQWMKARYKTIDALNVSQGNEYWSLTYNDWSEIRFPRERAQPAMWLDWLRFFTDVWKDYQQNQIDAMRPQLAPDKLLTSNFVAKYDEFDFGTAAQSLDVVGWDWYFEEPVMIPADGMMQHDLYRGFLNRNPWVLETAPGTQVGGSPTIFQPKGETRAMAWQAVGHGADGYAYWLWRSPINGTETAHGSLVDIDGRPRPVFDEIARTGGEIARTWPLLRGSTPVADVAMIFDYPNRWAIERQPSTKDYDVWHLFVNYRAALAPVSSGVDVLRDMTRLDGHRLVVAPNLFLLSHDKAEQLLAYVRAGGQLVIGPRSGTKDEESNLIRGGQLSPIADALGIRVDMSQALAAPIVLDGPLGPGKTAIWADRIVPVASDVETLLRYGAADGYLDKAPAVVSRQVGKGRITYVGAWLDDAALGKVIAWASAKAGAKPLLPGIPQGVELDARRAPDGSTVYVAINWDKDAKRMTLPRPLRDVLNGGSVRTLALDHYGVAVLGETR